MIVAGVGLVGCGGGASDNLFSRPFSVFSKQDWALSGVTTPSAAAQKPVGPEDLVDGGGACPGAAAPAPEPVAAADAGAAPSPPVGGVALEMTECEVVRRSGVPERVEIGASPGGERTAVITYLRGSNPGIYRFTAGRLTEIERVAQPEPEKKPPPRKRAAKPAGR